MKNISRTLRWLLLLAPLWFASVLMADETDLYYAQNMSANPNILFLLDNSGSMEYNKIGTETRMKVLQNVFTSVMSAVPSNLNIGLMRYGGHGEDAASGVSFPVKPVDLDKDGNGSAWDIIQSRIDPGLDNRTVSPDTTLYNYTKASLSEFANLGGSGLNKRMFFYEPDVALLQSGGKAILTLSIGSGYRTRPLHQGADRFYMLVDRNPFDAPDSSIFPITEDAKLVSIVNGDGTDNTSKLGTTGTSNDRLILTDTSLNGWYYSLPNTGEKVLAPAVTFLNKVVFTTFAADAGESTDPCESPPNSARAYVLDLFNGQAVADLDRVSGNERSVIAGVNEILDAAQIIFRAPSLADGTACTSANKDSCDKQYVEIRVGKMSLPLMGNDNASGAGVAGSVNIGNILPRMFWRDDDVSN